MALLLIFNSRVLNYIYFTQVIRPSWILQDKNLTSIYLDWPEKSWIINYASKISLILSNLKNGMPTGKIARLLLVEEIESIACCYHLAEVYLSLV
jgi:hypothetical protein